MSYSNLKFALPLIVTCIMSLNILTFDAVATPTSPAEVNSNACAIFKNRPEWFDDAHQVEKKWGIPVSTQLAIIHQESNFKANSRPMAKRGSGKVYASTAKGYSQALRKTWQFYLHDTNRFAATPTNFGDSVDFIGWYADQAHNHLGINVKNTRAIYLAYHEGIAGYRSQGYLRHRGIVNIADKVQRQANIYHSQLSDCVPQVS